MVLVNSNARITHYYRSVPATLRVVGFRTIGVAFYNAEVILTHIIEKAVFSHSGIIHL